MPGTSRLTLPENFDDFTSSMLLIQPEPQYLFTQLWMATAGASLEVPAALGLGDMAFSGVGAPYANLSADRVNMSREMFREAIAVCVDMSKQPGHTVRINRPQYANTTYTLASRLVAANASISTTPINVGSEQVALTIKRFAGPYDQANTRVAPVSADKLDASVGVHNVTQILGNQLKRDFHRFIDAVHVALGDSCSTILRPAGMTTDDTPTAVDNFKFDYAMINRAERTLDDLNIPALRDGFRIAILTPKQCQDLKDDPQFARYSQYFPEYSAVSPQYLTSVNRVHIFKSTTATRINNSSSVEIQRGLMFGPGLFASAVGADPATKKVAWTARSTDDNYGEQAKVIWVTYADWALADQRFGVGLRSC